MKQFVISGCRVAGASVCALCVLTPALIAADLIGVRPLHRADRILVSFELTDAFSEKVLASIRSGLPTTFSYEVERTASVVQGSRWSCRVDRKSLADLAPSSP